MFYKILKKIEEKDSLPINSIIEIENDKKFINLDGGGQIDIQFLIREEYLELVGEYSFKVGDNVATTLDYDSVIYFGKIIAIHSGRKAKTTFVSSSDWIDFDYIRIPSDIESKIYF